MGSGASSKRPPPQTTAMLELLPHIVGLSISSHQFTNTTEPREFCEPPAVPTAASRRGVVELGRGGSNVVIERAPTIFTNVFIARDLNTAPPAAQAAVLTAMADRRLPGMTAFHLPQPFVVVAFLRGGRSHLDLIPELRDLFMISTRLPAPLRYIVTSAHPEPPFSASDISVMGPAAHSVHVGDEAGRFARDIITACRKSALLECGPTPRASHDLLAASRAYALLSGQEFVTPHHIVHVAARVLAHRLNTARGTVLPISAVLDNVISSVAPPI
jgi:MoxR-like ATPase